MGIVSRSQGGGGGGAILFDSTLLADAASIDTGANGIAGTSNVLAIYVLARTDQAAVSSSVNLTLNNDSAANYDMQTVAGINVTASASALVGTAFWSIFAAGNTATAGNVGGCVLFFPAYAQTTFTKYGNGFQGTSGDNTAANDVSQAIMLHYRSTAAVSRAKIVPGGGTVLRAGSRLLILGT